MQSMHIFSRNHISWFMNVLLMLLQQAFFINKNKHIDDRELPCFTPTPSVWHAPLSQLPNMDLHSNTVSDVFLKHLWQVLNTISLFSSCYIWDSSLVSLLFEVLQFWAWFQLPLFLDIQFFKAQEHVWVQGFWTKMQFTFRVSILACITSLLHDASGSFYNSLTIVISDINNTPVIIFNVKFQFSILWGICSSFGLIFAL